tara:strand:- start:5590 stop:6735 length:1146 start_codon:yes stop_codon:yes gene_type:complete
MLQNKIYQNYIIDIVKIFFTILFGLTVIAWTVRAVNFLDLIVENGYSILTYFQYSSLNILGILTKFIPLSFLIALTIFVVKQTEENEFIILWTSGVKKIQLVHLFFCVSVSITIFYLLFSVLITPLALNKSRQILSDEKLANFLPTVRVQQFSDSFTGLTFIVDEKYKNQVKNIFLQDDSNVLQNISVSKTDKKNNNTIIARMGIVEQDNLVLLNGQIISSDIANGKNEIINFDQLNLNLNNLKNTTIKKPKIQETSTIKLLSCLNKNFLDNNLKCKADFKEEILPVLNRRVVMPFFIPVITLLTCLLLIKRKSLFLNKISVFLYSFLVLLYSELILRYTGLNSLVNLIFLISPIFLFIISYLYLRLKFSKEYKIDEQYIN